jgi:hypothetical protein
MAQKGDGLQEGMSTTTRSRLFPLFMYAQEVMRLHIALLAGGMTLLLVGLSDRPTPAQPTSPLRLKTPVSGCPVCELWLRYEDIVLESQQEVGGLHHGVFYFYHAEDPAIIEPLIRFAHERDELEDRLRHDASLRRRLGEVCGHRYHEGFVHLEISTSARGMFALLTADDPGMQDELRTEAGRAVRGKIPVWF